MNKPLSFMPGAWDDYIYWQRTDKKTLNRLINCLKILPETVLKASANLNR